MKKLSTNRKKRALEIKWKRIEQDFRKKYNLLNTTLVSYEGKFDNLLEKLQVVTGIKKNELEREIRTWDMDISDSYNF